MYAAKFITRYHNKFVFVANSLNQRCISMLLYLNIVSDESIKVGCNILYLNMVIDDNFKESTNVCCISHMINCWVQWPTGLLTLAYLVSRSGETVSALLSQSPRAATVAVNSSLFTSSTICWRLLARINL